MKNSDYRRILRDGAERGVRGPRTEGRGTVTEAKGTLTIVLGPRLFFLGEWDRKPRKADLLPRTADLDKLGGVALSSCHHDSGQRDQ